MTKKSKNIESMLEENSDEILLEETSGEETLLEESADSETLLEESEESEVLLEESSDEVLLEESADSETLLEEVDEKERKANEKANRKAEEAKRKAEEEAIRKAEEAERRRVEAERKANEEANWKAKETERKRLETERKVEVEAKRMEEEARKRQENIRNYGLVSLVSLVFLIPFVWGLFVNSDYSLLHNVFVSLFAAIPFGVAVFSVVGSLSNWSDNSFENFCILFGIFLGICIFVGTLVGMQYQDTIETTYAQISFSLFFADIMWFWVLRDPKESFWVMVGTFAFIVSIILWLMLTH